MPMQPKWRSCPKSNSTSEPCGSQGFRQDGQKTFGGLKHTLIPSTSSGPAIRNPRSTILGREKGGRDIIETLIPFATICVRHAYIMIVHANPARNPTIQDSRASTTKSEPGLKFRSHPLQSLHLTSSWITTYYKFPNTNLTNPPQSSTTHRHGSTTPHLGDDKSRICWPRRPLNPGGCHISGCESSSSSMLSSVFANQTLR